MKKIIAALLAFAMLFSLCACGGTNGDNDKNDTGTKVVTDACGRTVEIPKTVKSVVCVGVGALRFTTYLDALDLLAGVEENELDIGVYKPYAYLHQDVWEKLPQTGNNGETYDEQIIAANPDVIIANMDKATADAYQQKTGIPVVTIPMVEGILDDAVIEMITLLGDIYGKQERASELTAYLTAMKKDIADRVAKVDKDSVPSVYVCGVSFKGSHGFEGTEAHYGPLAELKATNIADATGQAGCFDMDIEQVLKSDPDYIFVDTNGLDIIKQQYSENPDFYNSLTAVRENRVFSQVSFRFCATNVELALADMYYMGTVIYPDAFADVDPVAKANEIFKMFLGTDDYCKVLSDAGYTFDAVDITK